MTGAMAAENICITNRETTMMKLMQSRFENIMKSKVMGKYNNSPVQKFKTLHYSRKNQYQALLQNFSPNPGTFHTYICIM